MFCRRLNERWMFDCSRSNSVVFCVHIVVFIFAEEMRENTFNISHISTAGTFPRD